MFWDWVPWCKSSFIMPIALSTFMLVFIFVEISFPCKFIGIVIFFQLFFLGCFLSRCLFLKNYSLSVQIRLELRGAFLFEDWFFSSKVASLLLRFSPPAWCSLCISIKCNSAHVKLMNLSYLFRLWYFECFSFKQSYCFGWSYSGLCFIYYNRSFIWIG